MIKTGWKNDISGNLLKYRLNESMKDREQGCINKYIYTLSEDEVTCIVLYCSDNLTRIFIHIHTLYWI